MLLPGHCKAYSCPKSFVQTLRFCPEPVRRTGAGWRRGLPLRGSCSGSLRWSCSSRRRNSEPCCRSTAMPTHTVSAGSSIFSYLNGPCWLMPQRPSKVTLARPCWPFLVVTITTPLAPREPHRAVEAASFNTVIDSISFGFSVGKRVRVRVRYTVDHDQCIRVVLGPGTDTADTDTHVDTGLAVDRSHLQTGD